MFSLRSAIESYLSDLAASGYSPATSAHYELILSRYSDFCENKKQNPLESSAISAYKSYLVQDRGASFSTVQHYIIVLRQFFEFCVKTLRVLPENPAHEDLNVNKKKLDEEQRHRYDTKLMTEQEIKALVTASRPSGIHARTFLRNRAIVLILVLCGLRNSELRALRPVDLDFEKSMIYVERGKGGKRREVPFPRAAQEAAREYLASGCRPSGLSDTDLLFGVGATNETWHEIDRFSLSTLVNRYVASATGHSGERSHALRHAFASTLLTNDVPIAKIQTVLGHTSIRTTEIYAANLAPRRSVQETTDVLDRLFA